MKITINDKEITLKHTFRSFIIYENITKKSFEFKGLTEILIYFYSTIMASDKELDLSFDDFIEWLDDNPQSIQDFSKWLMSTVKVNDYLNGEVEKDNENPKKV